MIGSKYFLKIQYVNTIKYKYKIIVVLFHIFRKTLYTIYNFNFKLINYDHCWMEKKCVLKSFILLILLLSCCFLLCIHNYKWGIKVPKILRIHIFNPPAIALPKYKLVDTKKNAFRYQRSEFKETKYHLLIRHNIIIFK